MTSTDGLWPWLSLALLGAFHGLNPAMGWLFAVALGLQEQRIRAVLASLLPIAVGHAASIGLVALAVGLLQLVASRATLLLGGGLVLLSFAGYKVATRFRHRRWVGMRVSSRQLALWSFLMATAHGAGLMLVPVLVHLSGTGERLAGAAGEHASHTAALGTSLGVGLAAVAVHSLAMLLAMGVIALAVYQVLGVEVLRRAWINLDLIWVGALGLAGLITLALGLWAL
jgi:hypothetical protein